MINLEDWLNAYLSVEILLINNYLIYLFKNNDIPNSLFYFNYFNFIIVFFKDKRIKPSILL